ncbi:zinc knuckle CX2CX4HX4C containing protein [Tanacetum coccineum]
MDINTKSTSYAGAAGASAKDQPKVNSNFRPLVVDPVFDGVNISIPRKVVEKVSTRFEHTLYGYFIGKRMAFPVVEYYVRNNWAKHGLKRIMMNTKGFFFYKFDSRAGLEAILEGGPWLIHNSSIILKLWSMDTIFLKEELTRISIWVKLHDVPIQVLKRMSSFARCLIKINSEADLVDVVTIGIPSLIGDDSTVETIRVEYEWRPPMCDICKIFGHVHDHCPKKVVSPPIVATFNVVTPTVEKTNDGFQAVGKKKKRKGKSKSTNGGPSVKPNVRYESKVSISAPKKGATHVGNASKSSSMLKTIGSSKNANIATSNSYSALNDEEEDEEEDVKNICMAKEDEEQTSFHTEQGTLCYEKMPFGLKNVGATYQRLMDNVFASKLGRNIEIYVDDMIIKSKNESNLISDIAKTFDTLRKANMKLNPRKCTFGALNGKLAALGHFLAKSVERSLAFFKTLKDFLVESPTLDNSPKEITPTRQRKATGPTSNNEAEYEALMAGLELDSLLITNQVKGLYEASEELMKRYLSIDVKVVNIVEETSPTWMDPIIDYLTNGTLPNDPTKARKKRIKAPQYSLKHDVLYRKAYLTPWLRCVGPKQANYVLHESHFGSCGAHAGARSIAQKIERLGYYWPTMLQKL